MTGISSLINLTRLSKNILFSYIAFLILDLIFIPDYFISHAFLSALIVLPIVFSKRKWEDLDKTEAIKWKKSIIFNVFLLLLLVNSIIIILNLADIASTPPIQREFTHYSILAAIDLIFVLVCSILFILYCILKKVPLQILSLPISYAVYLLAFNATNLLSQRWGFYEILLQSYILIVFPILPLVWAGFLRFSLLNKTNG